MKNSNERGGKNGKKRDIISIWQAVLTISLNGRVCTFARTPSASAITQNFVPAATSVTPSTAYIHARAMTASPSSLLLSAWSSSSSSPRSRKQREKRNNRRRTVPDENEDDDVGYNNNNGSRMRHRHRISTELAAFLLLWTNLLLSYQKLGNLQLRSYLPDFGTGFYEHQQQPASSSPRRTTSTAWTDASDDKRSQLPLPQLSSLAYEHSYGFFDDIPDGEWTEMYQHPALSMPRYLYPTDPLRDIRKALPSPDNATLTTAWWQYYNVMPNFACPRLKKVGGLGDGPKWTCDPDRLFTGSSSIGGADAADAAPRPPSQRCLVYSIGSNGNYRFEDALYELAVASGKEPCEIHVFDPGNYDRDDLQSKNVYYHKWGLTGSGDIDSPIVPRGATEMYSFQQIRRKLGHVNRTIDVFKIDCEGCEWYVFVCRGSVLYVPQANFLYASLDTVDPHQTFFFSSSVSHVVGSLTRIGYCRISILETTELATW